MSNENNCSAKFTTFNDLAATDAQKAAAYSNWRQAEDESKQNPSADAQPKQKSHNVH